MLNSSLRLLPMIRPFLYCQTMECVPRRLKDSAVNFDLLYSWTIQGTERSRDASLLSSSRRSIDQQMRKVSALRLHQG